MTQHTSHNMIRSLLKQKRDAESDRGVEQPPFFGTAFTDLIFEALSQEIEPTWIQKAVTLFADDFHCGDVFHSEWELEQMLCKFGILLDVIERHGLTISLSKSMVLISIGGTNCRKLQTRLIHRDDHGCFCFIPRADGQQSKLPVQKTACYLGVQMSYHMPEMLTLQHRMKGSTPSIFRLQKWLRARGIKLKTRLQLWRSCIYSTLVYGLFASNITHPGLTQLHTFIMGTLRQVVGNFSFLTRMTHSQFCVTTTFRTHLRNCCLRWPSCRAPIARDSCIFFHMTFCTGWTGPTCTALTLSYELRGTPRNS